MKKKFFMALMMMVMGTSALLPMADTVHAKEVNDSMHLEEKLISSNGILTPANYGSKQCGFLSDFSDKMSDKIEKNQEKIQAYKREEGGILDTSAAATNMMVDLGFTVVDAVTIAAKSAGEGQCGDSAADPAKNPSGFLNTIFNQTQIFTQMSNITYVGGLMAFVGIGQWFAILLMMFFILYKGAQAFRGKQIDPIGLILRFTATMFLIYLAPYLLQDILAINNILTHYVSNMMVTVSGFELRISEVLPASIIIMISQIQEMMAVFVTNMTNEATAVGSSSTIPAGTVTLLLLLVIVVTILIMIIVPFFKLVLWWYIRYFKIFVMAAISPFMFLTFADEETEETGYRFLKNFAVTAFEQFFMVIGVALTGVFIANALPLMTSMNLGIIGSGIAIYAAISFLATLPEVIGEWFRGGSGIRMNGGQMIGDMSRSLKNGRTNAVRGAGAAKTAAVVNPVVGGFKAGQNMAQNANWRNDAKDTTSAAGKVVQKQIERKQMNRRYGTERGEQAYKIKNPQRDTSSGGDQDQGQ